MPYNKRIKKIVNKMTDDKEKNIKIILRNIKQLEKESEKSILSVDAVLTKPEGDKLLNFMSAYLEILNSEYNIITDKNIRKFLGIKENRLLSKKPLLHTMICCGYSMSYIEKVLDLLNDQFANTNKSKVAKEYTYELIYTDNVMGQDFVSYYLEKALINKTNITSEVDNLINIINKYNIELGTCDVLGFNSLSFLNVIKESNENIMTPSQIDTLKKLIFKKSILTLITFKKDKDIEKIKSVFGDVNYSDEDGSLLHNCFNFPIYFKTRSYHINDYYILTRVKYLINLGINPNLHDKDGKSFIESAIDSSNNKNYAFCGEHNMPFFIEKILLESFKYGFDINCHPTLFKTYINKISRVSDALGLYRILCLNGFNSYHFNEIYTIANEKIKSQDTIEIDDIGFISLYLFNSYRDLLILLLEQNNLEIEDNFIKKYNKTLFPQIEDYYQFKFTLLINNHYNSLLKDILNSFEVNHIEEYFEYLVNTIIKLRNNSVAIQNKKVTVIEVLEALKYTIKEKERETGNKVIQNKTKILLNNYIKIAH